MNPLLKTKDGTDRDVGSSVRFLNALFGRHPPQRVAIRLWEGTPWPAEGPRAATLVLKHAGSLHAMFAAGTEKALAEAYLNDDFDVIGDLEAACEIVDSLAEGIGWRRSIALALLLRRLPARPGTRRGFEAAGRKHSGGRDRKAITFHYDVSNDFYQLWLDRRMVYSCAYFQDAAADLDSAQTAKLDHICRKLRLRSGQRLLDIGCGWGGLAIHAARHYGVAVTGVTLSESQASLASRRAAAAGVEERVRIRLEDYRDLRPESAFDAVVSVGMAEHVGRDNLPAYFRRAEALLRPGGVFLNHAIGEGCRFRPSPGPSFIDRYVFPDSDIPPIENVLTAAAGAGFEIRDVENLREHYALTLRHWVRRLEANHEAALRFVDEQTYRIWRLYMAGSAAGFAHGRLAIYQTLLAKPDGSGDARLPLTRADWYPPVAAR